MSGAKYNAHSMPLYHKLNTLQFSDLLFYNQVLFAYKFTNGYLPNTFDKNFIYSFEGGERERREDTYNFKIPTQGPGQKNPLGEAIKAWNRLPIFYKTCNTIKEFKREIKDYLVTKYSDYYCAKLNCHICK